MIQDLFEKLMENRTLTPGESDELLLWVKGLEVPLSQGIKLVDISDRLKTVGAQVNSLFKDHSVITEVSQMTDDMGVMSAGEFRSGNGARPGAGFTGGRYGWPGFVYNGVTFFLVGVNNDVAQVGLSLSDGKIYAGAGGIVMDVNGITFENTSGVLRFKDGAGVVKIYVRGNANGDYYVQNTKVGAGIRLEVTTTDNSAQYAYLAEDPANANLPMLSLPLGAGGGKFAMGSEVVIWAGTLGTFPQATTFNGALRNIDFSVKGDTDGNLFYLDASADMIGVGKNNPGYKLDVTGDVNVSGDFRKGGTALASPIVSGTYTPTLTNVTNITASVLNQDFLYTRLGNIVTVYGSVQIQATAAGVVQLDFTIPVASNFTTSYDLHGNATSPGLTPGSVIAEATNNRASLYIAYAAPGNVFWRIVFGYQVL
jgi:hypothetical protein